MTATIHIGRLAPADYAAWRDLAQRSQQEQCATQLAYWREPWNQDRLIWIAKLEHELCGYVYWCAAAPFMLRFDRPHPSLASHPRLPYWGIADLYVNPPHRCKHIASALIRKAGADLNIEGDEPIALSMPVQEAARGPLKKALGDLRLVVGYMHDERTRLSSVHPGTVDFVVDRSKSIIEALKKTCGQR